MSALLHYHPVPALREAQPSGAEALLQRELFELSARFAARERALLEDRERLLRTIDELHHRLRRAEMIGPHAIAS